MGFEVRGLETSYGSAKSTPRGNGEQQIGGTYGVWRLALDQPGMAASTAGGVVKKRSSASRDLSRER